MIQTFTETSWKCKMEFTSVMKYIVSGAQNVQVTTVIVKL